MTSERLTQMFLARIDAYDRKGPALRAVITINPKALDTARAMDAERKTKGPRSPLHGIPIVLKDNIDTADLPTTGGSVLLEGSMPPDDAFVVKKLAGGRRRDRGEGQSLGIRLRRRAQLARRTDPESARPHAITVRILRRHRRLDCRRVRDGGTRHRHRRLGARSLDGERHRRPEDDDGIGEP